MRIAEPTSGGPRPAAFFNCRANYRTGYAIGYAILDFRKSARPPTGMRDCSPVSRSRTVTVSLCSGFSPRVSKSTVTQYGVPISP